MTTRTALVAFDQTGEPYSGSTDPRSAGNGAIMRLAPVPLAFASNPERAIALAGDSARTTHGAETCVDASRYFAGLIVGAVQGAPKADLLAPMYSPVPEVWEKDPLHPKIAEIAQCSFLRIEPPEIKGTGYVVKSLEAALWAFAKSEDFEHGALLAVNLGDDADTTGAVYGQIAGAYYGVESIPEAWREKLAMVTTIEDFADGLLELAESA